MTIRERILNVFSNDRSATINSRNLKRKFVGTPKDLFHNSVMRVVRQLNEEGVLERVDRGEYQLSKWARKNFNRLF